MNELIKITEYNGEKAVSARELHTFLESKQEFTNWIKARIKKYDFIENVDFVSFDKIVKRETGATTLTEYALTINCAKELAMVEGNAKGKQARQYFIACEQALIGILNGQLNQATEIMKERFVKSSRIKDIDRNINNLMSERRRLVKDINFIDRLDFRQFRLNNF